MVVEQLVPAFALGRMEPEAAIKEVKTGWGDLDVPGYAVDAEFHVALQISEVLSRKRILTGKDLEENCAEGPHVRFLVIERAFEHFWSHVERCTANGLVQLAVAVKIFCQAKIAEFEFELIYWQVLRGDRRWRSRLELHQNIVEFDISMHNVAHL